MGFDVYRDLFDTYAFALNERDMTAIAELHVFPWILVKGDDHFVVENADTFSKQMNAGIELLQQQGTHSFRVEVNKVLPVTDRNELVNVTWHFLDASKTEVRAFSTSYLFVFQKEKKKIMSVVIDDEMDVDIGLFG